MHAVAFLVPLDSYYSTLHWPQNEAQFSHKHSSLVYVVALALPQLAASNMEVYILHQSLFFKTCTSFSSLLFLSLKILYCSHTFNIHFRSLPLNYFPQLLHKTIFPLEPQPSPYQLPPPLITTPCSHLNLKNSIKLGSKTYSTYLPFQKLHHSSHPPLSQCLSETTQAHSKKSHKFS